jgi:hypothetical protein
MVNVNVVAGIWGRQERSPVKTSQDMVLMMGIRDRLNEHGGNPNWMDTAAMMWRGKEELSKVFVGLESREAFATAREVLSMARDESKMKGLFSNLLTEQLPFLEHSLTSEGDVDGRQTVALKCLLTLCQRGNEDIKGVAAETVTRHFGIAVALAHKDVSVAQQLLVFSVGQSMTDNRYKDLVLNSVDGENNMRLFVAGLTENASFLSHKELHGRLVDTVSLLVFKNDIDPGKYGRRTREFVSDMVNSWLSISYHRQDSELNGQMEVADEIEKNLTTLVRLVDLSGTESVIGLYKRYGITHFGRYGEEVLSRQWADRDNSSQDITGIHINPYDDWNGAFGEYRRQIEEFENSVRECGRRVVFVEARDKLTIARRLFSVYNQSGLIDFLVIGAHGSPGLMEFGGDKHGFVAIKDLKSKGSENIARMYRRKMPIFFNSCSVGVDRGIVQAFSDRFSTQAAGPDIPTGVQSYRLRVDQKNRSHFTGIKYAKARKMQYLAGRKV